MRVVDVPLINPRGSRQSVAVAGEPATLARVGFTSLKRLCDNDRERFAHYWGRGRALSLEAFSKLRGVASLVPGRELVMETYLHFRDFLHLLHFASRRGGLVDVRAVVTLQCLIRAWRARRRTARRRVLLVNS
jgi:hypothetical protein